MKTDELLRRARALCREHGYKGTARMLGTSEGTVRRVFIDGKSSPAFRRAAAVYFGESNSWSSKRPRMFADMGTEDRKQILLEIMTEMGFDTLSQLLWAIADGQAIITLV